MSFTFDPKEMTDDLIALARAGSDFFAPHSVARVERLARDLSNAVAGSKSSGNATFSWRTDPSQPLLIRESRQWKGGTADFDPLHAEIEVNFGCTVVGDERILAEGVSVIRIKDPAKADDEKVFHFDAEPGGWHEIIDGVRRDRAGHPALHMQFYGMINDVPRLPSLIVHPVDTISFAILELHQKKWRQHLTEARTRSLLRNIPNRQRSRFGTILDGWKQKFDNPDHLPIVGMQSPSLAPLEL